MFMFEKGIQDYALILPLKTSIEMDKLGIHKREEPEAAGWMHHLSELPELSQLCLCRLKDRISCNLLEGSFS